LTIDTVQNKQFSGLTKTIILFSILTISLYAEAKVYVGTSVGYTHEAFNDDLAGSDAGSNMAKFKIGYGEREAYAIEFSLDYIDNQSTTFSGANSSDGAKYGLNVEFMKAFDFDIFVLPYFKAGFGAGYLDVHNAYDENGDAVNSLTYSSLNLGLGFLVPVNEHFDFEIGYDYKAVSYEKSNKTDPLTNAVKSNMNAVYAGFNVRF